MVVDSSALYAILTGEPDAPVFARTIEKADILSISAATLLEMDIVIWMSDLNDSKHIEQRDQDRLVDHVDEQ